MSKQTIALVLSLFALGLAGCGGDDDDDEATTLPTVPLSVPGEDTVDDDATDTTIDTVPDTATPPVAPAPPVAPTPTPAPAPTPDSPTNDTPPPPGSEAEQFEDFCAENPGAC